MEDSFDGKGSVVEPNSASHSAEVNEGKDHKTLKAGYATFQAGIPLYAGIIVSAVGAATLLPKIINLFAGLGSGITIANGTSGSISVAVEKELPTYSLFWYTLTPGQQDRWERKAGAYKVLIQMGGKECSINLTKQSEEVVVVVNKYKEIDVAGETSWSWV